jgi:hypothetical protein
MCSANYFKGGGAGGVLGGFPYFRDFLLLLTSFLFSKHTPLSLFSPPVFYSQLKEKIIVITIINLKTHKITRSRVSPFGHRTVSEMMTVRWDPSMPARSIFGFSPQSDQNIQLKTIAKLYWMLTYHIFLRC